MDNKKSKYDNHLKKILKNLLNDKTIFQKKFDTAQSLREFLVVYTVDEFIKTVLKVTDTNYKNELHRILKPHVKKLFNEEFKDLIKAKFELYQNKKKVNEQKIFDEDKKLKGDLRLIRTFLDDSSYSNLKGVKNITARLPHPDREDRIVVIVNLDKSQLVSADLEQITSSIWRDIEKLFGVQTYVQYRWI